MNHLGTVELETERLVLRRFRSDDAQAMFDNWAHNDEVTQYLTWPAHDSVDTTEAVIIDWVKGYADSNNYLWAVCLKENPQSPIGSLGLSAPNESIKSAEIGYAMGKDWWGKGYTAEAFARVIQFAFEEIGLNRIMGRHHLNNPNSGRVMEKCGLQFEGKLREIGHDNQGKLVDLLQYSILVADYSRWIRDM